MRASVLALAWLLLTPVTWGLAEETSCTACHSDEDLFETEAALAKNFGTDVHAEAGLSCHDCHGGNPSPDLADDLDAMDETFGPHPYIGVPARDKIPGLCGSCHSDTAYMRRFKPAPRVDQETEYWTSRHGIALARGDVGVAVCTDCHTVHSMRKVTSPDSSVYPTRVAETCNVCHGDAQRMAGRTGWNGFPIPVDPYARWRTSVHATALLEREDLSAPTCNDCHGDHGAAPPGLDSVGFVCGQCHNREAELFRASPKHDAFELHNELLADAGSDGCAACHEAPQSELTSIRSFVQCATCHGNHGIVRPTLAMFSGLPQTPCQFCHESTGLLDGESIEPLASRERHLAVLGELLAEARATGITDTALFDWLVDQALALPNHRLGSGDDEAAPLRPEFERLFSKFRIGKTYYEYEDPDGGGTVRAEIRRCGNCHDPSGDPAAGGTLFVNKIRELTALAGAAERILLAARRGGVETREAAESVDRVVDAQIDLQVLVHTFDPSPDGAFMKAHAEGLEHARAAIESGAAALDELGFRRKGLALALIVIVAVLIGLALKIKSLLPSP
ncbi:MAG: cytochrome c3 family protein [Acidobacteriota bacterium]